MFLTITLVKSKKALFQGLLACRDGEIRTRDLTHPKRVR
jgi:hypothetical protein